MIIKVVKSIDKASLSILELLEFGISRREIYHALANSVVEYDKTPDKFTTTEDEVSGDYYFKFLNTKVKLTPLALRLLENIKNR